MNSQNYCQLMSQAYTFTKELGLDTSDIIPQTLPYSPEEISLDVMSELLERRKVPIQDLGFNCITRSIEICHYLKERFSITPILTSGNLFRNNEVYFGTTTEDISLLVKNRTNCATAKFHTWLTISNYLFDFTLMTTEWLIDEKTGEQRYHQRSYCQPICFNFITPPSSFCFRYEPLFLGQNFFQKVTFTPILITIRFNEK